MDHVRNALIVKHLRMNGQKLRPTNETQKMYILDLRSDISISGSLVQVMA